MKKLILTSYVAHIPEIPSEVRKLTWRLPPSIVVGNGFDFDVSPLFVVDRLVIDLATYDYILTDDHEFLNPLRETLKILYEEGFLDLEDFAVIATKHSESLTKLTENALEHPEKWIEPVRQHWKEWDVIQPKIKEAMGRDYDPKVTPIDMGVYSYMYRQGKVNEKEAKRLGKILFSRKKRRSIAERTHLREMIRPHLSYVYLNYFIGATLGYPFLDWENMSWLNQSVNLADFFDAPPERAEDQRRIVTAKQLFSVALPQLRPQSATQAVKLLNKRKVKRLREKVDEIIENGEELTLEWGHAAIAAAVRANICVLRIKKLTGWAGDVVSLLPVPGASALAIVGEKLVDSILSATIQSKHKWLYSLFEATNHED